MNYIDNAATSFPKPQSVADAVRRAILTVGNAGRGTHAEERAADDVLYSCRRAAAELLGGAPERTVLALNATHALNIAIKGFVKLAERRAGLDAPAVVISPFEHNAVTRPLAACGAELRVAAAPLWEPGALIDAFRRELSREPAPSLAVCTAVSNVFGYVLPYREIAALCAERGVPMVLDASQGCGHIDISLRDIPGVSALCTAGHKGLLGPAGTGLLLLAPEVTLPTLLEGGTGQSSRDTGMPPLPPERYEAGTQNIPGAAGLAAGIEFVAKLTPAHILAHERRLADLASGALAELPGVTVWRPRESGSALTSGVVSFSHDALDSAAIADALASDGISVRPGLHCAPLAHASAGTPPTGTVRASFGPFNDEDDVDALLLALRELFAGRVA